MAVWSQVTAWLDEMDEFAAASDWDGLERHFQKLAQTLSEPTCEDVALPGMEEYARLIHSQAPWASGERAVSAVDLTRYTAQLTDIMRGAYELAPKYSVNVVGAEFDMDNRWHTRLFFLHDADCQDEREIELPEDLEEPLFQPFSEIYVEQGGYDPRNEAKFGVTLYLIARTVAVFGRAVEQLPRPKFEVWFCHHDQDPAFVISKPS